VREPVLLFLLNRDDLVHYAPRVWIELELPKHRAPEMSGNKMLSEMAVGLRVRARELPAVGTTLVAANRRLTNRSRMCDGNAGNQILPNGLSIYWPT
jgi:hypothetical protein